MFKVESVTVKEMGFKIIETNEGFFVLNNEDDDLTAGPFKGKDEVMGMINDFVSDLTDDE